MKIDEWYYSFLMPFQDYIALPGSFGVAMVLKLVAYLYKKFR
jgi:hypothetical protein